jgi:hypothetical protein
MAKLKEDPFNPVLTMRPDLVGALTRLASKLRKPIDDARDAEEPVADEPAPKPVRASRARAPKARPPSTAPRKRR